MEYRQFSHVEALNLHISLVFKAFREHQQIQKMDAFGRPKRCVRLLAKNTIKPMEYHTFRHVQAPNFEVLFKFHWILQHFLNDSKRLKMYVPKAFGATQKVLFPEFKKRQKTNGILLILSLLRSKLGHFIGFQSVS